jgi:hypothetical protein
VIAANFEPTRNHGKLDGKKARLTTSAKWRRSGTTRPPQVRTTAWRCGLAMFTGSRVPVTSPKGRDGASSRLAWNGQERSQRVGHGQLWT